MAKEHSCIPLFCWHVHFMVWACNALEMKFGRGGCAFEMKGRWMGADEG
jgi:hypothetical protein